MTDMLQNIGNSDFAGDPDCPYCHGLGFVGKDVPLGHPDFGKLKVCVCRQRELIEARQKKLYEQSNLGALREKSFENFKARGRVGLAAQQADSLEQAYNSAVHFAGTLQGWLLLFGRYGCGKTHLAAAIANQAVAMGMETFFLTVPDLLDWLRFAYSDNISDSFEERFEKIRDIPLLVMDDFGTQNATAWAQEKLFQILNYRYINKLATVITSNNPLSSFEGRIRSRLMDPELVLRVEILATDYRNPADDIGHPELSSLNLHARKTFESFSLRRDEAIPSTDRATLKDALEAAQAFARNPQGWLVFIGPYGCGKTHLAAAIGNYHAQLGSPPLMVVVPDLLDHLRAAFAPNSSVSLDQRFEEIRSARLLILDDLGTQSATPWAREKIYQLFNYRYNAELPTVITTVNAPEEMDPRLQSRLSDTRLCKIIIMSAPSYTGGGKGQGGRTVR
ncbi:MAG: ATP-binding protein [Chloroflexi bacterium]|nr:ATP-binding protein [Chloroflexota bacterium]